MALGFCLLIDLTFLHATYSVVIRFAVFLTWRSIQLRVREIYYCEVHILDASAHHGTCIIVYRGF